MLLHLHRLSPGPSALDEALDMIRISGERDGRDVDTLLL